MDCNLLEMSGYEASDLIKKLIQNEFYQDCFIIAYSADSNKDHYNKCRDSKMNTILQKPMKFVDLQETLKNVINKDYKDLDIIN